MGDGVRHRGGGPSAPPSPYELHSPPPLELVTKVQLHVSCHNVADMDVFSKSDPFVVVYTKNRQQWSNGATGSLYQQHRTNNGWVEVGRTETIWNNLNPDFVNSFHLDYYFEEIQPLKFEVYDNDAEVEQYFSISTFQEINTIKISWKSLLC